MPSETARSLSQHRFARRSRPSELRHLEAHPLTRLVVAFAVVAVSLSAASAADGYTYPRFQPVSVAFLDEQHGVLAEDDWKCQKPDGCQGRILVTSDGGAHWRVVYRGPRGMSLYPVRGTRVVYAVTSDVMIESTDAGLHWQHAAMRPVIVSFVTPTHGWRIGFTLKAILRRPPPIQETRDGGLYVDAAGEPVPAARLRAGGRPVLRDGHAWLGRLRHASNRGATRAKRCGRLTTAARTGSYRPAPIRSRRQSRSCKSATSPATAARRASPSSRTGAAGCSKTAATCSPPPTAATPGRHRTSPSPTRSRLTSADLLTDNLGYVLLRGCIGQACTHHRRGQDLDDPGTLELPYGLLPAQVVTKAAGPYRRDVRCRCTRARRRHFRERDASHERSRGAGSTGCESQSARRYPRRPSSTPRPSCSRTPAGSMRTRRLSDDRLV